MQPARALKLAVLLWLACSPLPAAAQYFPAAPAGFSDEKQEDHWRLDRIDSDTEWVRVIAMQTIAHSVPFATWFQRDVPSLLESFVGSAIVRSQVDRLNWRPTGRATLAFDTVVGADADRTTISVIGYETGYGSQLFLISYPPAITPNHPRFVEAVTFVQGLRDQNFRLTGDMLLREQETNAAPAAQSPPAGSAKSGSGGTAASTGSNCRNYQTGFYNKPSMSYVGSNCTTTYTAVPVYSYICK